MKAALDARMSTDKAVRRFTGRPDRPDELIKKEETG